MYVWGEVEGCESLVDGTEFCMMAKREELNAGCLCFFEGAQIQLSGRISSRAVELHVFMHCLRNPTRK